MAIPMAIIVIFALAILGVSWVEVLIIKPLQLLTHLGTLPGWSWVIFLLLGSWFVSK
ncbi:MAG: hypothetical protein VKJ24_13790 [Synechococcales bacterium]|nr:hypothetical protein [Synechococcales bacterium]